MATENPFQYENCPECGMPSFMHDSAQKRHVCINNECGYVLEDKDSRSGSLWAKILKALRLKK